MRIMAMFSYFSIFFGVSKQLVSVYDMGISEPVELVSVSRLVSLSSYRKLSNEASMMLEQNRPSVLCAVLFTVKLQTTRLMSLSSHRTVSNQASMMLEQNHPSVLRAVLFTVKLQRILSGCICY